MIKKNIMIFINSLSSGGAERVIVNLSSHLSRMGDTVSIVTIQDPEQDFYSVENKVRRIALVPRHKNNNLSKLIAPFKRLLALRSVIKNIQPDIIVGMMTKASIYAVVAGLGLKVHVVVSERNHPPKQPRSIFLNIMRRLTYKKASGVVALTQETANWMESNLHCQKITIIPSSITWPLPKLKPILSVRNVVQDNIFVFLAVGRLHKQKGHDLLIRSFAKIARLHKKSKLIILGDGPERENLEYLVEKENLAGQVVLPGKAGNILEWYQRADIFVLSSRYEGYGNVLPEAMACGCACISFDCDFGPGYIIEHNVNGLLVEQENIDALAVAMAKLINDEGLRARLADRAKEIRKKLSNEIVMKKWVDLFDQLLSKNTDDSRRAND